MNIFINLSIITFILMVKSESEELHESRARYDHYRMYRVEIMTEVQAKLLSDLENSSDSCIFYGHLGFPKNLTIMIAGHKIADIDCLLHENNIKYQVLVYNFQEKIDKQWLTVLPPDTSPDNYDWSHYFHLDTIYAWLEKIAQEFDHVSVVDLGKSHLGVPVKGIKLETSETNTAVFVESGIHAREWITPATTTCILNELLTSNDPEIQDIARNFNWILFPVVNPDGYKFSFEHDRMWRKNRKSYGICSGVDLNRNFPFHWNTIGVNSNPCHFAFPGSAEQSEIETQNIIQFITNNAESMKIKTYLALHSYSQLIMFPYGYGPEKVENYDDLNAIGKKAAESIYHTTGKIYHSGSIYETIYPSSGGSKDWAYAIGKVPITYTFELRGPPNSTDLFILPAHEILPTCKETVAAFKTILFEARRLGYYN